jgi:hypothetical protein
MTITKNIGLLLLAIYLIVIGLSGALGFSFGDLKIVVPLLALSAGVLILFGK